MRDEEIGEHGRRQHDGEDDPEQPDCAVPHEPVVFLASASDHQSRQRQRYARAKKSATVPIAVAVSANTIGKGASPASCMPVPAAVGRCAEEGTEHDRQEIAGIQHRAHRDHADGTQFALSTAPARMNHLPRKPAVGGRPIMLIAPMAKAPMVHGMRRPMPSSWLTSVRCAAV